MKKTIYLQEYCRKWVVVGDRLESHIDPLPPVISGVENGMYFRDLVDIGSFANDDVSHIEILIPNYACITPSFIQGLFGSATYCLGDISEGRAKRLAKFLSMYSFKRECDKGVTDDYAQILLQKDIFNKLVNMIAD